MVKSQPSPAGGMLGLLREEWTCIGNSRKTRQHAPAQIRWVCGGVTPRALHQGAAESDQMTSSLLIWMSPPGLQDFTPWQGPQEKVQTRS